MKVPEIADANQNPPSAATELDIMIPGTMQNHLSEQTHYLLY